MHLDKLFLASSILDKDILQDKVEFKKPLSSKDFYFCKGSSLSYVLLAPWHANPLAFFFLRRKIIKSGFSCLCYRFIPDILSPDVERTVSYFESISDTIKKDLEEIKDKYKLDKFIVMGFSLSSVTASMVSGSNDLVNGVILVVPGITLAESMWSGLRTRKIRRIMEKNGITLASLKDKWENLAPGKYAEGLRNKKVKIVLSKSDMIVPYIFGKELVDKVKEFVPGLVVETNKHLGHYLTMINYCLFSKNIDF